MCKSFGILETSFFTCVFYIFTTSDVYLSLHPFSLQREMSEVEIKITQEKDVTKNKRIIKNQFRRSSVFYILFFVSSQVPVFFFHLYFSFAK